MIDTILIANRGEIACRIMRTCRRLGIRTVAVYSDADVDTPHVQQADTAVHIGPAPTPDSYLNQQAVLAAARRTEADAIHPGYGFLAENPTFARACVETGLIFVGPSPEAMALMGHKQQAKERVAAAGVPVLPGYGGEGQSDAELQQAADQIGFPLLVKAAAGGGGKGMRLVTTAADLPEALAAARREAQQAFGSDELLLERALLNPRHVEIQILGDQHGNLLALGERECSIQRRHQKIIEETPSPALNPALRQKMSEAAVAAAASVSYQNAGTVEFLLDEAGEFYFLEMNTRLQVEHPVTELVTGLDLVEWQIRVAEGEALPWSQADIQLQGHAIEARIYCEDPARSFLPATGTVHLWQPPIAEGVRVDDSIQTGDTVTVHYDPMVAKIIATAADRQTAVRRLRRALETAVLLGVQHNVSFLLAVLAQPAFLNGDVDTNFIANYLAAWQPESGDTLLALTAVTLAQYTNRPQPATQQGYWRNNPNRPLLYRYRLGETTVAMHLTPDPSSPHTFSVWLESETDEGHTAVLNEQRAHNWTITLDGQRQTVALAHNEATWWVQTPAGPVMVTAVPLLPPPQTAVDAGGSLRAPMPGSVLAVLVKVGQRVQKGDPLLKLEAMKMEHTIRTAGNGVVEEIYYAPGDAVDADAQLLRIRPEESLAESPTEPDSANVS